MGIWTRGKPQGAALVVPGSDSPFPACLSLRRLPEVRISQTLPSLCSLLFQARHPLQMVKENPPLRKKDKASSCHEVFPKQCLVLRITWEGYYNWLGVSGKDLGCVFFTRAHSNLGNQAILEIPDGVHRAWCWMVKDLCFISAFATN